LGRRNAIVAAHDGLWAQGDAESPDIHNPLGRPPADAPNPNLVKCVLSDPPSGEEPQVFATCLYQEQTVLQPQSGAFVLGGSDHDAQQILRYGPQALSVQLHPEFTPQIIRTYIEAEATELRVAGVDVNAMLDRVGPAPDAVRLMCDLVARFVSATAN
jgi:GMP synthase (glutamine-hydrolysing)